MSIYNPHPDLPLLRGGTRMQTVLPLGKGEVEGDGKVTTPLALWRGVGGEAP